VVKLKRLTNSTTKVSNNNIGARQDVKGALRSPARHRLWIIY